MNPMHLPTTRRSLHAIALVSTLISAVASGADDPVIGQEVAIPRHLQDGEEYSLPVKNLIEHGEKLFSANWTYQEGGGRPRTKGTGAPLSGAETRLDFPDNFNRISAPDANSCTGCHSSPGPGGAGDIVANVFVLGQRFDKVTFDPTDETVTGGTVDEGGMLATLDTIGNSRATLGMYGSGYIEMLARQMTADLRTIRDTIAPNGSAALTSKGVSFGTLARDPSGNWDVSGVTGLVAPSLATSGPANPPSLIIRPFHQASNVISLRQFSNNAFNHHHGIQTTERFGNGADPDDDGFADEMTRADVTAVSIFQATLPAPGRMIPRNKTVEQAVLKGESLFTQVGCASCHVKSLPLTGEGWLYSEPNPYNPPGNETVATMRSLIVDLTAKQLPGSRLERKGDTVEVRCYTDFKVHDISRGPGDPNNETCDMNAPLGSPAFFAGNSRFLTRRLWDVGGKANFFHHGKFTTMRQAIANHFGEAESSRASYDALAESDRACIIEFLKSLRVLDDDTKARAVDEKGRARTWPPLAARTASR